MNNQNYKTVMFSFLNIKDALNMRVIMNTHDWSIISGVMKLKIYARYE